MASLDHLAGEVANARAHLEEVPDRDPVGGIPVRVADLVILFIKERVDKLGLLLI
jgi:hypothetical protein